MVLLFKPIFFVQIFYFRMPFEKIVGIFLVFLELLINVKYQFIYLDQLTQLLFFSLISFTLQLILIMNQLAIFNSHHFLMSKLF